MEILNKFIVTHHTNPDFYTEVCSLKQGSAYHALHKLPIGDPLHALCRYVNNLLEGTYIGYDLKNNSARLLMNFKKNMRNGVCQELYANGCRMVHVYIDDVQVGAGLGCNRHNSVGHQCISYCNKPNIAGHITEANEIGEIFMRYKYADGEQINSTQYNNMQDSYTIPSIICGLWSYKMSYASDFPSISPTAYYKSIEYSWLPDGSIIKKYYYPNGQLATKKYCNKNNNDHGIYTAYDMHGKLQCVANFFDDKLHVLCREFDETRWKDTVYNCGKLVTLVNETAAEPAVKSAEHTG